MGNEQKGHGLINAVTFDGDAVSAVKNIQSSSQYIKMIIKGQGKTGPSVKRKVGFDRMVTLSFVGQSHIAAESKGTLIAALIRADGVTIDTHQWEEMMAWEDTLSASDGDGNHDVITQNFEYEGDGDTDNYSYTPAN